MYSPFYPLQCCCSRLPVCTAPRRIIARGGMCSPCGVYWPNHIYTHTHAPTRTFYSPVLSVGSSFKLLLSIVIVIRYRTQNDDDRDRGVDLYGVALTTTRLAEGDVLMLLPTRVSCLPPCAFTVSCPPVGVLFEARVCQQIPSSTSFPLALSRANLILVCCSLQFPSSSKRWPSTLVLWFSFLS